MKSIINIEGEIWEPIPEWEDFYEVSNKGRVKMLERIIHKKDGTIQTYKEKLKVLSVAQCNQYLMVTLTDRQSNRHETKTVHRLVGIVFIPNPLNLPEVNHLRTKNEITSEYLEWSTRGDNERYAYKTGQKVAPKGADSRLARKIGRYQNNALIEEYSCMRDAEKQGYGMCAIRQAINNGWKCGGFEWKYLSPQTIMRKERVNKKVAAFQGDCLHKVYSNVNEIVKEGHDRSNIYKALKNPKTTSGGFVWKYLDEKTA